MVVTGSIPATKPGEPALSIDELSPLGDNTVTEFYQERAFAESILSPANFPLQLVRLHDLLGGDAAENATITRGILRGSDRGPRRDAVLLNAGAGLFVAGRVKSLVEGWELAGETIDCGQAADKLRELGG